MISKVTLLISYFIYIIYLNFVLVQCAFPVLNVKKVNNKLIERKRQDTLEICRIFNEETERRRNNVTTYLASGESYPKRHRMRRNVDDYKSDNPILKQKDILRVEKIVDKLYDDLDGNENHATYRQRNVKNFTKGIENKQHRRFNFAPAQLFGSVEAIGDEPKSLKLDAVKIPWIKKWKHGIIPFFIDPNTYDTQLSDIILKSFDYIEKVSCIRLQRLREKPIDKQSLQNVEWLYITNPSGVKQCVHSNERKPNTGVQMVVLGYNCLSQGEIAHEVMHVLGFPHEHTRSDRDRYITILWDNIKPGYKKYFETRPDKQLLNLPYDYSSVLHYPPRAFSKNGQVTLLSESGNKIGQRETLSELDVEKIGLIYGLECVERNKDYLMKTCPNVVKVKSKTATANETEIENYYKDRIWPYGIVNFKIKDKMEFTAEERENMKAVLKHIEKETCIEFRDINEPDDDVTESTLLQGEIEDTKEKDNTTVTENETETENNVATEDAAVIENKNVTENETISENEIITELIPVTEAHVPGKPWILTLKYTKVIVNVTRKPSLKPRHLKIIDDRDTSNENMLRNNVNKINHKGRTIHSKKSFQKGRRQSNKKTKTMSILPKSPARRHAANVIVLVRSTKPGCQCPPAGRPNGNKELIINADCFNSVNDLLHLFVHVLGLDHQHNMHDRDSYLHIVWENMTTEIRNEMKEKLPPAASVGLAYDYQSVMHYPWLQIKNGVTNIMYPIWNDGWAMGHWQGLSYVDVQKVNHIYEGECDKRKRHADIKNV